ncbi:relaxase/mobilization nuclease domain-containing protein [Methylovulum psychrotolerans]|nr:relaxase/mobilization nuclease domain-containing protein [Methylovulum psychrotolerans]
MSRKKATFGQLVDYFEDGRQEEKHTIYNNLFSKNAEDIKAEFTKNATFLAERKNGVYMYHEVLSITKSTKLSEEKQKEILEHIAKKYIQGRAKDNLVYGVLHDDKKDNLHYHFIISSNPVKNAKRHRLSKEEFSQFKKDLERYVLEVYPELEQKQLINKTPGLKKETGEKLSNKGAELKRRTGKTSQRDSLKDRLATVFAESKTKADFFNGLDREQLSIYVNGNTIGILDKASQRKHRLSTLGMLDAFNAISQVIEKAESQKIEPQAQAPANASRKEKVDTRAYRNQQQNSEAKPPADKEPPPKIKPHYDKPAEPELEPESEIELELKPESEMEREIAKRKAQMKKARDQEPDYSKDLSKGK